MKNLQEQTNDELLTNLLEVTKEITMYWMPWEESATNIWDDGRIRSYKYNQANLVGEIKARMGDKNI